MTTTVSVLKRELDEVQQRLKTLEEDMAHQILKEDNNI
jgi:hypothetical protein